MCTKWMHHAEILIGHFGEMVGNWPVASCYFALCHTVSAIRSDNTFTSLYMNVYTCMCTCTWTTCRKMMINMYLCATLLSQGLSEAMFAAEGHQREEGTQDRQQDKHTTNGQRDRRRDRQVPVAHPWETCGVFLSSFHCSGQRGTCRSSHQHLGGHRTR